MGYSFPKRTNPDDPVYHYSRFPWEQVETSGAIHVGDIDQAMDMQAGDKSMSSDPKVNPIILAKGGSGGGSHATDAFGQAPARDFSADGAIPARYRAFSPPPSVPNGGLSELQFNPGVGFHDVDLEDQQANTAHLEHSREADYARGRSIDQSALSKSDTGRYRRRADVSQYDDPLLAYGHSQALANRHNQTADAIQALRENKVLRYKNTHEGSGESTSYIVPNPDINLRQFGEDPRPVAGKSYHQTPLFDLASVKSPGPFDDAFSDDKPNHIGLGDVRKPNTSRTRRRPIKATTQAAPTAVPGQEPLLF